MVGSENDLKRQLQWSKQHSKEPAIGIYRLLSISMVWPEGLRILLQSYAPELPEATMSDLLEDAILCGVKASVQALLDFAPPIGATHLRKCISVDIWAIVAGCFITRRKTLLRLGLTVLPRHAQQRLGLQKDLLPDQSAHEVYAELEAVGADIDQTLRPCDKRPIFHHALQIHQMESLYEAGFRDINAVNEDGYTPMLCLPEAPEIFVDHSSYVFDRALWFFVKGASPYLLQGNSHTTPKHILSANIAYALYTGPLHDSWSNTSEARTSHQDLLRQVCTTDCRDKCHCYCSIAGCSSLSMALRQVLSNVWYRKRTFRCQREIKFLKKITTELQGISGVSQEVIRLLTFTDLELTHTCCQAKHWIPLRPCKCSTSFGMLFQAFDKDEAIEIHDEERILLADFEDLVEQLNADYTSSSVSLWEFLETRWSQRIMDYLSLNGETIRVDSFCSALGNRIGEES
ncbi:hypothetical protein BJY00DRAFT_38740 [Aspergillus carlsbadensis]|nr:hypothetical protein BJY00DRAFT_38740 [Aspergillus carlsbadensis]